MNRLHVQRVSEDELRQLLLDSGFEAMIHSGELTRKVEYDGHPSPRRSGEPRCTRSQILAYTDSTGRVVLRIHRYLRRGGVIGGSGKPDPKYLLYDNIIYKQQ